MHELSITQDVVRTVVAHTDGRAVRGVRLRIGTLAGIVPDAVRFCFDLAVTGTTLEGAWLDIEEELGRGHCRVCGTEFDMPDLLPQCPCGSTDAEVVAGRSLVVASVEVV
ncbi:hydrogenase maturation nickel metallochaperone HypA [Actinotalea sp. M2MS4P-6]|uniref:hydrogenase maturation nickel metallochaperone HypA/HybF n=1 Tax=Actinotalea sp. M2MS4P-6 TaxID=2983762 RepID=UPI0021E46C74|nr:hydrogenase maturation nickel metallochaperone HypA [Actinotalea sp. M2MS4P-6]MCV2394689.1 hydrogenase maturation nickel metallochaperone HypA [Actinotalea sp. M2MS4P-6]